MNTGELAHDFPLNLFFIAYFLITNVVMLNIVVAVLLDEFVNTTQEYKDQKAEALMSSHRHFHVLDPLLDKLVHFSSDIDLSAQIQALFNMLDLDDNGGVGYEELKEGLRKLSLDDSTSAPITLSLDEFTALTLSPEGRFCDSEGEISKENFHALMRHQLVHYVQRQLAFGSDNEETRTTGFSSTQACIQGLQVLVVEMQESMSKLAQVQQQQQRLIGAHAISLATGHQAQAAAHATVPELPPANQSRKVEVEVEVERDRDGTLGIAFHRDVKGQPFTISSLVPGGAAERSQQLAVGDDIWSVDGVSMLDHDADELKKRLSGRPGCVIKLGITRAVRQGAGGRNLEAALGFEEEEEAFSNPKHVMFRMQSLEAKLDSILTFFGIMPADAPGNSDEDVVGNRASPAHMPGVQGSHSKDEEEESGGRAGGPASAAEAWKHHKKMMISAVKRQATRREQRRQQMLLDREQLLTGCMPDSSVQQASQAAQALDERKQESAKRWLALSSREETRSQSDDVVDAERKARRAAEALLLAHPQSSSLDTEFSRRTLMEPKESLSPSAGGQPSAPSIADRLSSMAESVQQGLGAVPVLGNTFAAALPTASKDARGRQAANSGGGTVRSRSASATPRAASVFDRSGARARDVEGNARHHLGDGGSTLLESRASKSAAEGSFDDARPSSALANLAADRRAAMLAAPTPVNILPKDRGYASEKGAHSPAGPAGGNGPRPSPTAQRLMSLMRVDEPWDSPRVGWRGEGALASSGGARETKSDNWT